MYDFNKRQLDKLDRLRNEGIDPYPSASFRTENINVVSVTGEGLSEEELGSIGYEFPILGRLMFKNEMGRLGFGRVEDHTGKIQFMVKKADVDSATFTKWKRLDVGDWVYVSGRLVRTKTGELTIAVSALELMSKCIEGMPDKRQGVSDVETTRRCRYLDLATSSESRERFLARSKIITYVRRFFEAMGFIEVETPILQPIPGGASAKPFISHYNALSEDMYLRIAPELYLKRLLVGGFPRVFEIGKNFRNEGLSSKHNPEFTMIEFYAANNNYNDLIHIITSLLIALAPEPFRFGDNVINFSDVKVIRFDDAIASMGIDDPWDLDQLFNFYEMHNEGCDVSLLPQTIGGMFNLLFDTYIEHKLINPTFVTHFPTEISPLARKSDDNPLVTDRFELFIAGQEIANGFTELNDPVDQAERFEAQMRKKAGGDDEAMYFDNDYIKALSYGMPPAAGAGIGLDRLIMILTNTENIKDIILFPTMKNKGVVI